MTSNYPHAKLRDLATAASAVQTPLSLRDEHGPLLPQELEERVRECAEALPYQKIDMMTALRNGCTELLSSEFDSGHLKSTSYTGFLSAALLGIEALVRSGLPGASTQTRKEALVIALRLGHTPLVKLLLSEGVPLDNPQEALVQAVSNGFNAVVSHLLASNQIQLSITENPLFLVLPILIAAQANQMASLRVLAARATPPDLKAARAQAESSGDLNLILRLSQS